MPPDRDAVYLWDMLAIERRIEIIGEAARRISEDFKKGHPEIPWRLIVDQRNVLILAYDEIADERIWKLTVDDIPRFIEQLEGLLPAPPSDPEPQI
jgi:uncharacterized protein with HEPN domain